MPLEWVHGFDGEWRWKSSSSSRRFDLLEISAASCWPAERFEHGVWGLGLLLPSKVQLPWQRKAERWFICLAAPWMVTRLGAGHSFGTFSVHFFTDDNSPCSRNAREIHEFSPLELIFKAWAGGRAPLCNPAEFPWQKHEGWEVGIGTGKWGCWLWDFWSLHFSSENWKWDS